MLRYSPATQSCKVTPYKNTPIEYEEVLVTVNPASSHAFASSVILRPIILLASTLKYAV